MDKMGICVEICCFCCMDLYNIFTVLLQEVAAWVTVSRVDSTLEVLPNRHKRSIDFIIKLSKSKSKPLLLMIKLSGRKQFDFCLPTIEDYHLTSVL